MATFKIRRIGHYLHVIWTDNYQVFKRTTGIRIEWRYWDNEQRKVKKNHPNRENIQKQVDISLGKLVDIVNNIQLKGITPSPTLIKLEYQRNNGQYYDG